MPRDDIMDLADAPVSGVGKNDAVRIQRGNSKRRLHESIRSVTVPAAINCVLVRRRFAEHFHEVRVVEIAQRLFAWIRIHILSVAKRRDLKSFADQDIGLGDAPVARVLSGM